MMKDATGLVTTAGGEDLEGVNSFQWEKSARRTRDFFAELTGE